MLKTDRVHKYILLGKSWLYFEFFFNAYLWKQINVTHIVQHNHQKAFVNTFLLVALKYIHKKIKKIPFFIANTSDWVSLILKLAVLGQNWEVNRCLRPQNISSFLDGIDGSKAVEKALLEVLAKIGEAKS